MKKQPRGIDLHIEKTLTLSTGHLKENTVRTLSEKQEHCPNRVTVVADHEYGLILFVNLGLTKDDYKQAYEWYTFNNMKELVKILKAARKEDCSMINFDRDASESSEFKTFEWTI